MFKKLTACFIFCILFFSRPILSTADDSFWIFQALEEEMQRSLQNLKIDVFEPPYFIQYQVMDQDRVEVSGSFGALIDSHTDRNRKLFVDVRVGDSWFDSSTQGSHQHPIAQFIPLDADADVLKRAVWYETDLRYKQAIMNFLKKKGRFINGMEPHKLADFSEGQAPQSRIEEIPLLEVDIPGWENSVRRVSKVFKNHPDIEKSKVRFLAQRTIRYFLDSEGNKIRDNVLHYNVLIEVWTKTDLGSPVYDQKSLHFSTWKEFPTEETLVATANNLIKGVQELLKAPTGQPFVGPAVFSPDASAVLFHEAIGHRLEADRLRVAEDGKTFLNKIGAQILPPFISIEDNPQLQQFEDKTLIGHYRYDDQGQESQEVVLVNMGILKNFLLSRTPVLGFKQSNGHARSDGLRRPMSRMGNVIIRSQKWVTKKELKKKLIEEIKRQKKPYGFIVKKILSGETQTESHDFQVFKGKPLYIYKVYPENGHEELVRGVDFVGTPLSMISKILMTSNDYQVINGFCDAESGTVPVTSIAPSILLREIELQTAPGIHMRKPILPPPSL